MTPKEKAEELVYEFEEYSEARISDNCRELDKKYCSIQCALIVVDEMLVQINELILVYGELNGTEFSIGLDLIIYWQEVKQEIEKL